MFALVVLVASSLLGGCGGGQFVKDAATVLDKPRSAAIAVGIVGAGADLLLGGNGIIGGVAGAVVGDAVGTARQNRAREVGPDGSVLVTCDNTYSYNTNGTAVQNKKCRGPSVERMPASGFPQAPTPAYGSGASATPPPSVNAPRYPR